jgi:hypothetical protein
MSSNPDETVAATVLSRHEVAIARPRNRPWSLVTRLAVFYTLGATGLLLVIMVILYGVVVQHAVDDDNGFLIDKLRAVLAYLANK